MNIEAERSRRGLSKSEMSDKMGVSRRTYGRWITEQSDVPSSILIKMAKEFGVSVDYLLQGAEGR